MGYQFQNIWTKTGVPRGKNMGKQAFGGRGEGVTPRESLGSVTHRAGRLHIFLWLWCRSEISLSSDVLSTSNVQQSEGQSLPSMYAYTLFIS